MPERLRSWQKYAEISIRNPVFVIELLLVILLIAILYAVTSLRGVTADLKEEQTARISIAQQNQRILREIRSCTNPNGVCAKRGNDSQGAAISTINKVSVYAAFCANSQPPPASVADVEACVRKELAQSTP